MSPMHQYDYSLSEPMEPSRFNEDFFRRAAPQDNDEISEDDETYPALGHFQPRTFSRPPRAAADAPMPDELALGGAEAFVFASTQSHRIADPRRLGGVSATEPEQR